MSIFHLTCLVLKTYSVRPWPVVLLLLFLGFFGTLHCGKIFNSFYRLKALSQEQYIKLSNNQTIHFQPSCFLYSNVAKTVGSIPVIKETTRYKLK